MQRDQAQQQHEQNEEILHAIVQMADRVKNASIYTADQRNAILRAQDSMGVSSKTKHLYNKTKDRAVVICALLTGLTHEEICATLDSVRAAVAIARDEAPLTLPGFSEKPTSAIKDETEHSFKIY